MKYLITSQTGTADCNSHKFQQTLHQELKILCHEMDESLEHVTQESAEHPSLRVCNILIDLSLRLALL